MKELQLKAVTIAKKAEDRKREIESERNIPIDLISEVKEAGLVRMWATSECGGTETSVSEVSSIISRMAYYSGSMAWVTGVTNCSSLITGFITDEMAQVLYQKDNAMIGGFAGPAGMATMEGNQLRVKGKWSWGSGVTHCSHIVAGTAIIEGDKMVGTAIVFFNPDEVAFHDNWQVMGLKGTHSIDYSVKSTLIPKERWTYFPVKSPISESLLYRFSFLGALSVSIAAVGKGMAERALDEIKKIAMKKSPFGQGKLLSDRPDFQEHMAKAIGNYKAAESLLKSTITELEKEVKSGPCSIKSKANLRLATAHATALNTEVVNSCYRLAGGSAIWQDGKLEELFRDMNVVSQHGMVNRGNYRTGGAIHLDKQVPEFLL